MKRRPLVKCALQKVLSVPVLTVGCHTAGFRLRQLAGRYPTGYVPDGSGGLKAVSAEDDPYRRLEQHPFGGISVASTAEDYLRFSQMPLQPSAHDKWVATVA